jgi:large subunit ribosomal protein L30
MSAQRQRAASKLRVRQVRSGAGFDYTQKATLRALGLGRIGKLREHPDNPQVRGMIAKVTHLVVIEDGPEGGASA